MKSTAIKGKIMNSAESDAGERAPDTDGNRPQHPKPVSLENQNVTRPAPPGPAGRKPAEPEQKSLENLNVTGPAPIERS
jgi:hypothetical protein